MIEHDDIYLVKRCLEGNTDSFEELVMRYQRAIFNLAYRMTNNIQDSEDITQTVFIKVYERMNMFDPRHKFFSWIYRIALNETLNYLKRRDKIEALNEDIMATEKKPDEVYQEKEITLRVRNALMELPLEYKVLIILKHFQNFSYADIAYILDTNEKKVKSRLYSARQSLKNILLRDGLLENG